MFKQAHKKGCVSVMIKEAMRIADCFTGLYPVSKTLRFELRPVGKTQKYIEKHGILDDDFQRAED